MATDRYKQVLERDNYCCQRPIGITHYKDIFGRNEKTYCGKTNIEIHHIIYRSQGGSDEPDNLVCLCREHHIEAHSFRQWRKYYETKGKRLLT